MMNMNTDNEIPLCKSCGHHHILGIKCDICGHVGKSQIFEKMRVKANEKRAIQMNVLHSSTLTNSMNSSFILPIIFEIRKQLYEEYGIIQDISNNDIINDHLLENTSSYLYMTIGDSPSGIAHWIYLQDENNKIWNLTIDQIYILPNHRKKYYTYQCLYTILYDISVNQNSQLHNYVGDIDIPLTRIFKHLTNNIQQDHWFIIKLQSLNFVLMKDYQGNIISLRLHISDLVKFNNLLIYLQSKFNNE